MPVKPTNSVIALESGISMRRKFMLATIERLSSTARSALTTVIITSWKGTTAQAMLRPGATPGRSMTSAMSAR